MGFDLNRKVARAGGEVAKNIRKNIEKRLVEIVVTKDIFLSYKYIDEIKNNC